MKKDPWVMQVLKILDSTLKIQMSGHPQHEFELQILDGIQA